MEIYGKSMEIYGKDLTAEEYDRMLELASQENQSLD